MITVTPVANMPERAPQRDPRVVAQLRRQLDRLRRRHVVEAAVADPVGTGPHRVAAEREVELGGRFGLPGMDWTNCYMPGGDGPAPRPKGSPGGVDRDPGRAADVRICSPGKLLFPADGITKLDLADYYVAVAPVMAPHVKDRPLNVWRWNAGIDKPVVVQQEIPKGAPDWVRRVTVRAGARAAPSPTPSAVTR